MSFRAREGLHPHATEDRPQPVVRHRVRGGFELDGQRFVAINGGPQFTFNEAISLSITCADQAEVDYYWERLTEGGEDGPCGWLKDRYGVSWQVVPDGMDELFSDPDRERAQRAMEAMLRMRKLDIAAIRAAADGVPAV